jgi:hypothetical protein
MMNKEHLRGKHIVFRLRDQAAVYSGTVILFESDGFWVEAPVMISQLKEDVNWSPEVETIHSPVVFVPTSNLAYLIASAE